MKSKTLNINKKKIFFPLIISLIILLSAARPVTFTQKTYSAFDDTIYIYDTVYLYDTVYINTNTQRAIYFFDTLKLKTGNNKILATKLQKPPLPHFQKHTTRQRNKYLPSSYEYYFSTMYSNLKFTSENIYQEYSTSNNKAVNPRIAFAAGVNTSYDRGNTKLITGLGVSILRSNFNYFNSEYTIDSIPYYKYYQKTFIKIDTILFINIDTLLATGDTVYQVFQDTNYIQKLDSAIYKRADTTTFNTNENKNNKYIYLEIPFIIGKSYKFSNFQITPNVGIISGFMLNSTGKLVSLIDINQSVDFKEETKKSFINLSLYCGFKFEYYISNKINFTLNPFYRRSINSIFSDYPLIVRTNIWGAQFGLKYIF